MSGLDDIDMAMMDDPTPEAVRCPMATIRVLLESGPMHGSDIMRQAGNGARATLRRMARIGWVRYDAMADHWSLTRYAPRAKR